VPEERETVKLRQHSLATEMARLAIGQQFLGLVHLAYHPISNSVSLKSTTPNWKKNCAAQDRAAYVYSS
jgi:hypothetical protein